MNDDEALKVLLQWAKKRPGRMLLFMGKWYLFDDHEAYIRGGYLLACDSMPRLADEVLANPALQD